MPPWVVWLGIIGGGWDTWVYGGKNCDAAADNTLIIFGGSAFDESAYQREFAEDSGYEELVVYHFANTKGATVTKKKREGSVFFIPLCT